MSKRESVCIVLALDSPDLVQPYRRAIESCAPLLNSDELLVLASSEVTTRELSALPTEARTIQATAPWGTLTARNAALAAASTELVFFPSAPETLCVWRSLAEKHTIWRERFAPLICIGAEAATLEEADRRFGGLVVENVAPYATMWRRIPLLQELGGFDVEFDRYACSWWYGDAECQRRAGRMGFMVAATSEPGIAARRLALSSEAEARLAAKQIGWLAIPWVLAGLSDLAAAPPISRWRSVVASVHKVMSTKSGWRYLPTRRRTWPHS